MKVQPIMAALGVSIILVLTGLAAYLWTPDKSRSYLEARYLTPDDAFVTLLGTRIRVRDTGLASAPRPPIIMLHGFGSSLETWQDWAVELGADRRVIRFDLPGSGLSFADSANQYNDQRTIALLVALMDEKGIAKADIIGNSIGGRVAWQFASAHPDRVRKLVLVSPDGFASSGFEYGKAPNGPGIMVAMTWVLPKSFLKANLDPSYGDSKRLSAATVTRYHDLMLGPGNRAGLLARMEQTVLKDPTAILPTVTAPTLLLWGEKDAMIPIANSEDYLALLPDASRVVLAGLGHVPFEEAPLTSIIPLRAFLDPL